MSQHTAGFRTMLRLTVTRRSDNTSSRHSSPQSNCAHCRRLIGLTRRCCNCRRLLASTCSHVTPCIQLRRLLFVATSIFGTRWHSATWPRSGCSHNGDSDRERPRQRRSAAATISHILILSRACARTEMLRVCCRFTIIANIGNDCSVAT